MSAPFCLVNSGGLDSGSRLFYTLPLPSRCRAIYTVKPPRIVIPQQSRFLSSDEAACASAFIIYGSCFMLHRLYGINHRPRATENYRFHCRPRLTGIQLTENVMHRQILQQVSPCKACIRRFEHRERSAPLTDHMQGKLEVVLPCLIRVNHIPDAKKRARC